MLRQYAAGAIPFPHLCRDGCAVCLWFGGERWGNQSVLSTRYRRFYERLPIGESVIDFGSRDRQVLSHPPTPDHARCQGQRRHG